LFPLFFLGILSPLYAQQEKEWEFVKERDGIRIYLADEPNTSLKAFRGEATLKAGADKVIGILGNAENFDWWDESISTIDVLTYEKDKYIRYYLVYDVPWPLNDRDLCVEAFISRDTVSGIRTIFTQSLNGVIPEEKGNVRITKYWQRWTVIPKGKDQIEIILEGFADPGGYVPAWLYNLVITDTPLNVIHKVKERVE